MAARRMVGAREVVTNVLSRLLSARYGVRLLTRKWFTPRQWRGGITAGARRTRRTALRVESLAPGTAPLHPQLQKEDLWGRHPACLAPGPFSVLRGASATPREMRCGSSWHVSASRTPHPAPAHLTPASAALPSPRAAAPLRAALPRCAARVRRSSAACSAWPERAARRPRGPTIPSTASSMRSVCARETSAVSATIPVTRSMLVEIAPSASVAWSATAPTSPTSCSFVEHQLGDLAHVRAHVADGALDLARGALALAGELAHLLRHDGEPLALLARARRLDRGVEGEEVGLAREPRDPLDEAADAVRHLVQRAHALGAGAHAVADAHQRLRRAVDRVAARRRRRRELADRLLHRLCALVQPLGCLARVAHLARAVEREVRAGARARPSRSLERRREAAAESRRARRRIRRASREIAAALPGLTRERDELPRWATLSRDAGRSPRPCRRASPRAPRRRRRRAAARHRSRPRRAPGRQRAGGEPHEHRADVRAAARPRRRAAVRHAAHARRSPATNSAASAGDGTASAERAECQPRRRAPRPCPTGCPRAKRERDARRATSDDAEPTPARSHVGGLGTGERRGSAASTTPATSARRGAMAYGEAGRAADGAVETDTARLTRARDRAGRADGRGRGARRRTRSCRGRCRRPRPAR